ncbi:MAG TPA: maleylpyruvate isomerase family mycothiol-dependent enzyme [Candidatus Nanopelagicaceae bacterium]|nr:maleylpyruvate isomerase family mycothiol-dependent enzyme [Candidatus Nanopelagicaceae bacterium]
MRLDRGDYLASVKADSERVGALCVGRLDLPVPSCPGWAVRDAVVHLGFVHRVNASRLRRRSRSRDDRDSPTAPDDGQLPAWFAEGVAQLEEAAAGIDPTTPVWNWSGQDQTAGFWFRRMAHETVVHRWDVEAAALDPSSVPPGLAQDGIDEFFEVFWARQPELLPGNGQWLQVHTVEGARSWWIAATPSGASFQSESPSVAPDAALVAAPSELFLALWRRLPADVLTITGDHELAARFLAAPAL